MSRARDTRTWYSYTQASSEGGCCQNPIVFAYFIYGCWVHLGQVWGTLCGARDRIPPHCFSLIASVAISSTWVRWGRGAHGSQGWGQICSPLPAQLFLLQTAEPSDKRAGGTDTPGAAPWGHPTSHLAPVDFQHMAPPTPTSPKPRYFSHGRSKTEVKALSRPTPRRTSGPHAVPAGRAGAGQGRDQPSWGSPGRRPGREAPPL